MLPLSTYTTWTWKCDLHNLLHFLSLRLDSHAQYEIRVYADQIWKWVCEWVPVIAEAFTDYRLEGCGIELLEVAKDNPAVMQTGNDPTDAIGLNPKTASAKILVKLVGSLIPKDQSRPPSFSTPQEIHQRIWFTASH